MGICDIYVALKEERPYRKSLDEETVWSIIEGMVDKGELDGSIARQVKEIVNQ